MTDVNVTLPEDNNSITFVSYNVGLLRFKLFGAFTVFSNPPHASKRLPHIPKALKEYPADVLAIQECYDYKHAEFLWTSLADLYPHHARVESGGFLKFQNGLLILSKHPISKATLQPYHKVSSLERHLATKSNLIVEITIPALGKVTLVNMHTTAGGTVDPEHPGVDSDREDELRQAIEVCNAATKEGGVGIIIGDLNCGPEASAENFQYVLNKGGFRDTYAEAAAAGTLAPGPAFTWDPANYLNAIGPHKECPGQRCDHVLLPAVGMEAWAVTRAQVLFPEACVEVGGGIQSTLSDHHGLLVTVTKR
jgi:endonuclease/exonuclease/phosphatase family metal-dependent hydrolase